VVSNDTLIDAGVVSAVDLARLVPAAQFSAASSPFPLLYMRGVGSDTGTSFTDPAVTLSYDGYWSMNSGATDSQAGRLQLLMQPGSDLSVNLGTDYYRSSATATNGVVDQGTTVLQIPISSRR
jgi:hypothetical protein